MREGMFIKRNVDKWNRYQQEKTDDPDEMAERFVTLVDDLSYAKTFYPQSKTTRWINTLRLVFIRISIKIKKKIFPFPLLEIRIAFFI